MQTSIEIQESSRKRRHARIVCPRKVWKNKTKESIIYEEKLYCVAFSHLITLMLFTEVSVLCKEKK
jgi:hypothetical protein